MRNLDITPQEARAWRRQLGLRLVDLHVRGGVPASKISEFEAGTRQLSQASRAKLIAVLEAEEQRQLAALERRDG